MKEFIKRFSDLVKGTLSGFDRIVFKGLVLPLMSSSEVMSFCRSRSPQQRLQKMDADANSRINK